MYYTYRFPTLRLCQDESSDEHRPKPKWWEHSTSLVPHRWKFGAQRPSSLQRRTLQRFDSWVAVSSAAQRFARENYGLDMPVVPNPVNVASFAGKQPFPQFADTENIVYVNRLVERKGCGYLIDAVHYLDNRGKFDGRKLIICGKGPLRAKLEAKVKQYGLGEKVHFAGFISEEDKPRYLASAALACYPSIGGESFGIVLIEALAAGAITLGGITLATLRYWESSQIC